VAFWQDYVESASYMVDDGGKAGGLPAGARFVIAGDLNADPQLGDGDLSAIQNLHNHVLVNQAV
ncbi:endonuclease/exonuclease/phosphatase family protein, partial [Aeromonas media]|uniref:endonuclease/exonuclease/phosphatase family protein n=1 Tax=Aeromonas media TaxID=651 RepID=UPI001F465DD9